MIHIKRVYIDKKTEENKAFLSADIELSKQDIEKWTVNMQRIEKRNYTDVYRYEYLSEGRFSMWYSVDIDYADYLCCERSDAFIVGMLYFAIVSGADISSDVPMTDRLYYQLVNHLIPGMCKGTEYRPINIACECLPEIEKSEVFVGTGASGGVDSFASILLGVDKKLPQSFKLTHLCYFNVGALNFSEYLKPYTLESWNKNANSEFEARAGMAAQIADEMNLKLVTVNSNISDLYQGAFLYSVTYRTCSAVLATQKMWSNYYFASNGYKYYGAFSFEESSERFDNFILPNLSLGRLAFYSGDENYSRFEKTELLCQNSIAQKHLNVCSYELKNCGRCDKCIRTILALDVLGELENFSQSFSDLQYYKNNKRLFWGRIRYAKKGDNFMIDLRENIERRKIKYPKRTRIYPFYRFAISVKRKLKKITRGRV